MPAPTSSPRTPQPLDWTSGRLLARARDGDATALSELCVRHWSQLRRWAHGRLPRWVRTITDTADVVQEAMLRTLGRLDDFEPRGRQALRAYLRETVLNRIRDEHRRIARRGTPRDLDHAREALADAAPSPLDVAIGHEAEARYRAALERLSADDRELIVAHVELHYTHAQLGCMGGRSPHAARMALQRALGRLAAAMRDA